MTLEYKVLNTLFSEQLFVFDNNIICLSKKLRAQIIHSINQIIVQQDHNKNQKYYLDFYTV